MLFPLNSVEFIEVAVHRSVLPPFPRDLKDIVVLSTLREGVRCCSRHPGPLRHMHSLAKPGVGLLQLVHVLCPILRRIGAFPALECALGARHRVPQVQRPLFAV